MLKKSSIFCVFLFLLVSCLQAETMYIGHAKSVMLYSKASSKSSVIADLNKGAPVELLKTNLQNGFSYVRTAKNTEGWLQTSFLLKAPAEKQYGFFTRMWHHMTGWHSEKKRFVPVASAPKMTMAQMQDELAKIKAQEHSAWFWFIWGAIIALLAAFIGIKIGRSRERRRARSIFH